MFRSSRSRRKVSLTHRLAHGNLQDLGGEADGAFNTELLVLGSVDKVGRD